MLWVWLGLPDCPCIQHTSSPWRHHQRIHRLTPRLEVHSVQILEKAVILEKVEILNLLSVRRPRSEVLAESSNFVAGYLASGSFQTETNQKKEKLANLANMANVQHLEVSVISTRKHHVDQTTKVIRWPPPHPSLGLCSLNLSTTERNILKAYTQTLFRNSIQMVN